MFFEEAFIHESDGLIAYTLKDEWLVRGFMTLSRQLDVVNPNGWCISALFVRRNGQANHSTYHDKAI